jgi:alkylation response protein AidB-like acyl-CoA dehydrogenase
VDPELSAEQQQLQASAIEFARTALGGSRIDADRTETFDREGWHACARFGLLGMAIPEPYGGLGLGLSALLAVMEGLGVNEQTGNRIYPTRWSARPSQLIPSNRRYRIRLKAQGRDVRAISTTLLFENSNTAIGAWRE